MAVSELNIPQITSRRDSDPRLDGRTSNLLSHCVVCTRLNTKWQFLQLSRVCMEAFALIER